MLLPVVAFGGPGIFMLSSSEANLGVRILFAALTLVLLAGAVLMFRMKLVTKLDARTLSLLIYPLKWSLLRRRMTQKDIPLGDISEWEVRTYNSVRSREYWGWHVWGLGVAKKDRYLYVMRPSSPVTGRGVQLHLSSGERVLVGSERPEELENAITTAKRPSQ